MAFVSPRPGPGGSAPSAGTRMEEAPSEAFQRLGDRNEESKASVEA